MKRAPAASRSFGCPGLLDCRLSPCFPLRTNLFSWAVCFFSDSQPGSVSWAPTCLSGVPHPGFGSPGVCRPGVGCGWERDCNSPPRGPLAVFGARLETRAPLASRAGSGGAGGVTDCRTSPENWTPARFSLPVCASPPPGSPPSSQPFIDC